MHIAAVKVFENYYQALVSTLPMRDEQFVVKLQKHNLLSDSVIKTTLTSLSTSREKASYFLDYVIKPKLHTGNCFDELLKLMTDSDYEEMQDLGTKVTSELNKVDSAGRKMIRCILS